MAPAPVAGGRPPRAGQADRQCPAVACAGEVQPQNEIAKSGTIPLSKFRLVNLSERQKRLFYDDL